MLNNEFIGITGNNETIIWELEKVDYTLKTKAGLILKSQEELFFLNDNENKHFEMSSFQKGYLKTYLMFKGIG